MMMWLALCLRGIDRTTRRSDSPRYYRALAPEKANRTPALGQKSNWRTKGDRSDEPEGGSAALQEVRHAFRGQWCQGHRCVRKNAALGSFYVEFAGPVVRRHNWDTLEALIGFAAIDDKTAIEVRTENLLGNSGTPIA
jgi:hypothetical protein